MNTMKCSNSALSWYLAWAAIVLIVGCTEKSFREVKLRYDNGNEEVVRTYPNKSDSSKYLLEEFHAAGGKRVVGRVNGDTATLTSWYENGQKEAEWSEILGLEYGFVQCWYANGQLKKTGTLNLGNKVGEEHRWHDDGRPEYEATFANGRKEGRTQYWSGTGRYISRTYNNDTLSGPSLEIDSLGMHINGQYLHGLEEGLWTWTDSTGKLSGTTTYHFGKVVE